MGLAKEYSGKRVIDGLSLDVEKGDIFGFLGPNGAGKSTVIRILTTLRPTAGRALINGFDVAREPDKVKSHFDIVSLCREVFEFMEDSARQMNIKFQFGSEYNSPLMVWADREKIRQALINLIDNSIKYGKEGGRTKVSFYDMAENILTEISDNGLGIEEQHIPRLFERFYRVDKHRSREKGGSGLGLAIVKHIIEAHEQTVNVRSAPGVGSTFSFTLRKG